MIGLDPAPGQWTTTVGSVADREQVRNIFDRHTIQGVIHAGALHKPDIVRYPQQAFIDTNVTGTLNLLEEASARNLPFVFTSTTSLMVSQSIRDETSDRAIWMDEDHAPIEPRNIYGASKLAAEALCRQHHLTRGLNVIILRTSRFFPEEDDTHNALSGPNMKMNELLNRRATVEDMARAHLAALDQASIIGFGLYIVSAQTPFSKEEVIRLKHDAPAVIRDYYPDAPDLYAARGWQLPATIGRVYDGRRIQRDLGFSYRTDFKTALNALRRGDPSPLSHDASYTSPLASEAVSHS